MKRINYFSVFCLALTLTTGAAVTTVYAIDEGDSAREAELANARQQVEHAKAALYDARKNLTLLMEGHGSDYPQPGFLGLFMMPAPSDGVRVVKTVPGAAAARAGIRSGDLIVAIDGNQIPESLSRDIVLYAAYDALANIKLGDRVAMTVVRGERRFDTVLTAGARKSTIFCESDDGCRPYRHEPMVPYTSSKSKGEELELGIGMIVPAISVNPARESSVLPFMEFYGRLAGGLPKQVVEGLELAELNTALGRYFGVSKGVLVVSTPSDGLPGLAAGDVILSCGDRTVTSPRQIMHMLMSYEQGDQIQLTVMRDGRRTQLNMQLPQVIAGVNR